MADDPNEDTWLYGGGPNPEGTTDDASDTKETVESTAEKKPSQNVEEADDSEEGAAKRPVDDAKDEEDQMDDPFEDPVVSSSCFS